MRRRLISGATALVVGSAFFMAAAVAAERRVPDAPALEFGRVRVATGPTLHYAAQGPADGPVFLMLHGLSDSWYSFSPILPMLPEDWRVYALTLRGHGDSDKPRGDYSPGTLAGDVVAFMDAMGIDRATMVGHSLGSIVVQHALSLAPERFERVVLIGTARSGQVMPGMNEFRAAIHALPEPVPVDFAREFQVSTIFVPQREVFLDSVIAESAKLPGHVWRASIDGMLAAGPAADLERVRVPTLLLWGDRDTYMPFDEQRILVEALRARLVVYPQIGHAVHWEDPGAVVRDLLDFVERTPR